MTETGIVYAVETVSAGATVLGDHDADSTTLDLLYGWEFSEEGGQARVSPGPDFSEGIFRKWSGDGRGGSDDKWDTQSAGVTEDNSGTRSPRLKVETSGNNAFVNWGDLGVTPQHAVSATLELPAYPSSNVQFMVPLSESSSKAWQVNIQSSGVMRIVSPTNTNLATGSVPLPLNETFRIEVRSNGTDLSCTAYDLDGEVIEELTATGTFGDLYNFRIGSVNSSTATLFIDDVAINAFDGPVGDWWLTAPQPQAPRVGIIGDSLTAQEGRGKTELVRLVLDAGYAPASVSFYAVGGKPINTPDVYGRITVDDIADARQNLGDIEKWIIALGTNDSDLTETEFADEMAPVLAALGDDEFVWVGLAFKGAGNTDAARLNPVIEEQVSQTPNGRYADWQNFIHDGRDETGLWGTVDSTHMTEAGYAIRNQFMVSELGPGPFTQDEGEDITFEYTSATYPEGEDDDEPTVLELAEPLGVKLNDGDFVEVLPERRETYAWVTLKQEGEALRARVRQDLEDVITEEIVDSNDSPMNVLLEEDSFGDWVVVEVLSEPLQRDGQNINPNTLLPPQVIPEEGVTQFAQAVIEEAVIDHLQGRIAVIDELIVARYADDGSTEPAPDSAIISLSSQDGLKALSPNGAYDGSTPLYDLTMKVPTEAFDEAGNRIVAEFRGKIIADHITVLEGITVQGEQTSHFAPGTTLQLDNLVDRPDVEASVEFDAEVRNWPGSGNQEEIGWGLHSGRVAQGLVRSISGGYRVTARFITPTGVVDQTTELTIPFSNVAGFTAGGGYVFLLAKFAANTPWAIYRFNANTGVWDNTFVAVGFVAGPGRAALSYDGGPLLVWRDPDNNIFRRYYNDALSSFTAKSSPVRSSRRMVGARGPYIASGSHIDHQSNDAASAFWSRCGVMTGFGQLPDGTWAATNGSGSLFVYNIAGAPTSSTLYTAWTKVDSATGRETLASDVSELAWPAGTFPTIHTPPPAGAFDDVEIYVSDVSGDRTDLFAIPSMPVGRYQVTITDVPSSGANPPSTSGFVDDTGSTPARLVSGLKDSNGDPLLEANGNGEFSARIGVAGQSGRVTVSIPSSGSAGSASVVFAIPFEAEPNVQLTVASGVANPENVHPPILEASSATGFTVKAQRTGGGTADIAINWHAMPMTQ